MKTMSDNIIAIISLVLVVVFAIFCSYIFHNVNGTYCSGNKCNVANNDLNSAYKKLKHYNVELFTDYDDYKEREKGDKALKADVELDKGDFRKNNIVLVTIPKQECGIFRFTRFSIEDNEGIGLLERRNKNKCFETTRHFYKKIDKNIKITSNNIKVYFTELNNEYE